MKKCGRCLITKSTTEFGKNSQVKDGLAWACKECGRKHQKISYLTVKMRKSKVEPLVRNCGTCAWQYNGKCSVRSPGSVTTVDSDDKCGKWERIREREIENEFADDNYENSLTAQFEGINMHERDYAIQL